MSTGGLTIFLAEDDYIIEDDYNEQVENLPEEIERTLDCMEFMKRPQITDLRCGRGDEIEV